MELVSLYMTNILQGIVCATGKEKWVLETNSNQYMNISILKFYVQHLRSQSVEQ
jgi:hypothetical protein